MGILDAGKRDLRVSFMQDRGWWASWMQADGVDGHSGCGAEAGRFPWCGVQVGGHSGY